MIAGIVLAGGASSRMGRTKALLPIDDTTFVARIVSSLQQAGCARVLVVAGAALEEIEAEVRRRAQDTRVVHNPAPGRGQLSSLQVAIEQFRNAADANRGRGAAESHDEPEAAVVALCDHPLVRVETVRCLIEAWRTSKADVVRPAFGGRHGHPVVFARRMFPLLLATDPETGARAVVRAPDVSRVDVEVDDPGVFVDVDTPDDFARLSEGPVRPGDRSAGGGG